MMNWLEWVGCALGLFGALLLALNSRVSAWGFVFFLGSNVAWMSFALMHDIHALLLMQIGFTGTSLLGIYRWRKTLKE